MNKKELLQKRAEIIRHTRKFFESVDFVEVQTPLLVANPGLEPHLHYFETQFTPSMGGGEKRHYYLPTSPEYHLKKALSFGLDRIFEITKSFRNGEKSEFHEPEFLMLEWYRMGADYRDIADDCEKLFSSLSSLFDSIPHLNQFEHMRVSEAFQNFVGIDLDAALEEEEGFSLREQAKDKGFEGFEEDMDFEESFHKIFLTHIEPQLGSKGPTFLWDFPAAFSALSRPTEENALYCERFEVYWEGVELANAFGELLNPSGLRRRCLEDHQKRMELYGESPPLDEEFLEAHELMRCPKAGGIALGLDRLIQVLLDQDTLQEALPFPHWS